MKVKSCRICRKEELEVILDYEEMALSDSFLDSNDEIEDEKKYPMNLCFCHECKHLQIDEILDPGDLFSDYIYATGFSDAVIRYAKEFHEIIKRTYDEKSNGSKPKVLEIASNDGTVLSVFKENGSDVLGIDPARNIVEIANERGINSIAGFFNLESANTIIDKFGSYDIVIGRNVMAHVADLHGFAEGISVTLSKSGFAVIEVPHLQTMFQELQYDQVFHEHIGYHSLDSFVKLFSKFGMEVIDVETIWIHGGSIRVYLQHINGPREISKNVESLIEEERNLGLYELSSWRDFARRAISHKDSISKKIREFKEEGKKVAVYGASGKGQCLLQFCKIDNSVIDYVVDKSELKHGKITPGTHIPIYPTEHIHEDFPDVILLCAWNFADEIIEQQSLFLEKSGKFLHPFPEPHYVP